MGRNMILRAPSGILPVRNRIARPGRPRIEFAPPRPMWRGLTPNRLGVSVEFETAICDRHGRIERVLQRGKNTITNTGMDSLASQSICDLINYLVLSSTNDARKRVMSGPTLTVTYTSPTNISVSSDVSFFVSADAGRTLKLPNVPELKITTYTSGTQVTCQTPSGDWLPGFVAPGSPTNYGVATIYYTNLNTLATYFTQFNTYDAGGQTELTDNANSRFIHERIFLSATVSGSDWTVNQLGWSDGNGSHNCFGIANLASPDVIPVGKKYRVKLDVYLVYTPLDQAGVSINWGATIGAYTCDIRSIYLGTATQSGYNYGAWLEPWRITNYVANTGQNLFSLYRTAAYTMTAVYWQGQTGGTAPDVNSWTSTGQVATLGAYTTGAYKRTKNIRWPDTVAITNATALGMGLNGWTTQLVMKPQSGTITKPSGYWCDWTVPIYWTRDLPT